MSHCKSAKSLASFLATSRRRHPSSNPRGHRRLLSRRTPRMYDRCLVLSAALYRVNATGVVTAPSGNEKNFEVPD